MRIRKHKTSHIVQLADHSVWRIWPADIPKTLQWRPRVELEVVEIEHEICSHALVDRAEGSQVRVIDAKTNWPVDMVRQLLSSVEARQTASDRAETREERPSIGGQARRNGRPASRDEHDRLS